MSVIGLRLFVLAGDIVVRSGEVFKNYFLLGDFFTGVNTFKHIFYVKLFVESTKVVRMGTNSETI